VNRFGPTPESGWPESGWHRPRHSVGAHAAPFGVNPWLLMTWMGHKRLDETMLYVHVAENHRRELPEPILAASSRETDPDRRVVATLDARGRISRQQRGNATM
jgi:hypothetical protein